MPRHTRRSSVHRRPLRRCHLHPCRYDSHLRSPSEIEDHLFQERDKLPISFLLLCPAQLVRLQNGSVAAGSVRACHSEWVIHICTEHRSFRPLPLRRRWRWTTRQSPCARPSTAPGIELYKARFMLEAGRSGLSVGLRFTVSVRSWRLHRDGCTPSDLGLSMSIDIDLPNRGSPILDDPRKSRVMPPQQVSAGLRMRRTSLCVRTPAERRHRCWSSSVF